MPRTDKPFVPAVGFHWLTRFYDPLIQWGMRERANKRALIEQASVESGHRILDLGCGTGTLALLLRDSAPNLQITGLDADEKMLAVARQKEIKTGELDDANDANEKNGKSEIGAASASGKQFEIDFRQGYANQLPFEDGSFDRVVSSLMIHHLTTETKSAAFAEVFRVLRPGGEFHVADWGPRGGWLGRAAFLTVRLLDGFEITRDNYEGRLPLLMEDAGFLASEQTAVFGTVLGPLALFRAVKPS